jgi:ABC-type branched-subunit amino acid transport system substrate-binding protein
VKVSKAFVSVGALSLLAAALLAASARTASNPTVNIGISANLSGAVPLPQLIDGYKAAFADVNAKGGVVIGGKKEKLNLVVLDNKSDLNLMAQQMRTLVLQKKVSALLGNCCQWNINASSLADALKTPLVMSGLPLELAPKTTGYRFLVFQALADGVVDFYKLAATAGTNNKVAIVTNNDAQGGQITGASAAVAKQIGFDVVTQAQVPVGTTDFSDVINKAKSANAQVLFAEMILPDCFAFWKQMKALGYQPKVAIGLQCAQTPGWPQLGSVGNGTLLVSHWTADSGLPQAEKLNARFGAKWHDPSQVAGAVAAYTAAQVLIDAVKRAHSASPKAIDAALKKTNLAATPLGPVKFDSNLESKTTSFIGQWLNGNIRVVFPPSQSTGKLVVPVSGLGG